MYMHLIKHFLKLSDKNLSLGFPMLKLEETANADGDTTIGKTIEALKKVCKEEKLFPDYDLDSMLRLSDDVAFTKLVTDRANVACTDVGWMKIDDCEGTIYTTLADLQRTVLPPGEIDFEKCEEEALKFKEAVMKLLRKEKEQILEFSKSIPAKFVEAVLGNKKVSNSATFITTAEKILASTFEWNEPNMEKRMTHVKKFDISTIPSDLQTSVLQLDLVPGLVTSYRDFIDEQLKECNKLFDRHVEEVLSRLIKRGNLSYVDSCFLAQPVGAAPRKSKVILKFSTQVGQSPHAIGNDFFVFWYECFKAKLASFTTWLVPRTCFKLGLKDHNQAVYEARKKLLVEMLDVSQALKSFKDLQVQYSPGADQYAALYKILFSEISTLITPEIILNLLGSPKKIDLLYKASRDGYSSQTFHSKCDNKGATLTIFRTTTGKIAGGYTPVSWNSSSNGYVSVPQGQAYIFSTDGNKVTKYNNNKVIGNSIYCHAGYGPTFGSGHCLHISNNSDVNTSSNSNGDANASHPYGLPSQVALVGSNSFTTNEIEVFQIR